MSPAPSGRRTAPRSPSSAITLRIPTANCPSIGLAYADRYPDRVAALVLLTVVIVLGVCLTGGALALNVSWVIVNWRQAGMLILGLIAFPLIILAAVFIPILFMSGILGRLLHEFAVVIGAAFTALVNALVKDLLQQLSGTVEVESELNKGSRFTVSLPAPLEESAPGQLAMQASGSASPV